MKKLLLYGLSLSLVFSLAACASKSAPSDADAATDAVQTDQSQDNEADDLTQAISNVQQSDDATSDDKTLFYPNDQTLYAVEAVNIHEHYSEDSKIVGSLAVGDSIHCIGVGIEEDTVGWCKAQLSDGGIVYAPSLYLMTSKPDTSKNSTANSKNSGTSASGNQQGGSSGSSKAGSEAEVPSQGSTDSGGYGDDDWIDHSGPPGVDPTVGNDTLDPSEWEAGVKEKYDIYG